MAETLKFSVTPYNGFEREILDCLNKNRTKVFTQNYLDWAYIGQKSPIPPKVSWVSARGDRLAGMAAFVFRPYWVNNRQYYFAIVRDISINREFRGKGIGKRLFKFINSQVKYFCCPCALVIPTSVAQKIFASVGWETVDTLISYVFFLNPA